jgi:hypothetical protein
MADDPKGPGSLSGDIAKMGAAQKSGTAAAKGYTVELQKQQQAVAALNQELLPSADKIANLDRRNKEAAQSTETLTGALKEQYTAMRQQYEQYTSLNGMVKQAGTAVSGYASKLGNLLSIQGHYQRRLDMIRQAQDMNTKSMLNTTASTEKASKNMQRYLNDIKQSHFHAAEMVGKYNISMEESSKIQKDIRAKFGTQMGAYKDLTKTTRHLAESTIILSKSFGVDASEATDYMQERLQVTNKTLKEVERESFLVAKAVDKYTQSLQKNGQEALRTAKFTKQQLVAAIRDANKQFSVGQFDAAAYASMLGPLAAKFQSQMKATNAETQLFVQGVARMMGNLQDADLGNLFGIQGAQDLIHDLDANMDKLDAKTRDRVLARKKYIAEKRAGGENISEVQELRMMIEASRGSAYMMEAVMKKMQAVGNPEVRARLMEESGLKGATASQFMAGEFGEKGVGAQGLAQAHKDRKNEHKEAQAWRKKLSDSAKKQQTPREAADKAVLKIYNTLTKIETWLKYSLMAAIGVIIARMAIGGFRQWRRFRGRGGAPGMRGGPPSAGRPTGGPMGGGGRGAAGAGAAGTGAWGAKGAAGAAPTAAKAGRLGRAGQALKGAGRRGMGFMRGAGGKMLGAAGVALTVGHGLYAAYKKKGGAQDKMQAGGEAVLNDMTFGLYGGAEKRLMAAQSKSMQRKMGKDRSFSRLIAEGGGDISKAPWYLAGTAMTAKMAGMGLHGTMRGLGTLTGGALGRSGKEQKILDDMDRRRVSIRRAITKEEAARYYHLKGIVKKSKTAGYKMTKEEQKQLKLAKKITKQYARVMKLREEGFKASIEQTHEGQYTDTAKEAGKLDKSEFAHIKDPKKRTHAIIEKLVASSGRLFKYKGGADALVRMLEGKGGKTMMSKMAGVGTYGKLKALGVDMKYAKELAPQMVKKFQQHARLSGAGTSDIGGAATEKEQALYEQIRKDRERKGMKFDRYAMLREFMKRKKMATGALDAGSSVKISTDTKDIQGEQSQDGKYDRSTGTMTYNIVTPLKINVGPLASATANETALANQTDNNSPGG